MAEAEQGIQEFFARYRSRAYKKGQILIFAGDKPDSIFHLESGNVKQYDISPQGDEITINVFKPPAFFPMSTVLNDSENPYIFEAETDITVKQAPTKEVVEFIHDNPEVAIDLLKRVYRGMDGILARMAHLMKSSARDRLVYEILVTSKRFGKPHESDGSFTTDINEHELASRSGLTRETVSREMQKLMKDGLVDFKSGQLHVADLAALAGTLEKD